MEEKEAEEDAQRELKLKEKEETQKRIQEVIDKKKKDRMEQVDYMYKMGLQRIKKEEKEDPTEALRNKYIEEAENKAYRQWEENNQKRYELMATVDASRHALIQKRKNDKEQVRSIERTYADMMTIRNQELD